MIFMNVGLKKEKFRQMGIFLEMFVQLNGYSLSNSQAVIGDYTQCSLEWTSATGYLVS